MTDLDHLRRLRAIADNYGKRFDRDDLAAIRWALDKIGEQTATISTVLALTDTGSDEFRQAFPPRSAGESIAPREIVPGWRVVEKIREALLEMQPCLKTE